LPAEDLEIIESYAEVAGDENVSAGEPMMPVSMRHHLLSYFWQVLQTVAATVPAVAEDDIIVGPIAAATDASSEPQNAADVAEGEALLCEFPAESTELFEPTDWREVVRGFDASLAFLTIARSDLWVEEFESSSAISMITGD
jgi:hypothetical protein